MDCELREVKVASRTSAGSVESARELTASLIEERRRWVKSLKSTVLERMGRRMEGWRVRLDVARVAVGGIDHGPLRLLSGCVDADVVGSSTTGDSLGIAEELENPLFPYASYRSEFTRTPSIGVPLSSMRSNMSSSSSRSISLGGAVRYSVKFADRRLG